MRSIVLKQRLVARVGEDVYTPSQIETAIERLGRIVSETSIREYAMRQNLIVDLDALEMGDINPKYWIAKSKVQLILDHYNTGLNTGDIDGKIYMARK